MSHRVASSPLWAGSHVVSKWGGLGIPGAEVPLTGDSGGSPLANDSLSPTAEYRIEVETPPSAGTLRFFPDTSFEFSGAPDGYYTYLIRAFEDGVDQGTESGELRVGLITHAVTGALSAGGAALAGSASRSVPIGVTHEVTGALVGGGALLSGVATNYDGSVSLTPADIAAIADAVWAKIFAAAQTTPIHADARKMNGATILGNGTAGDKWRG